MTEVHRDEIAKLEALFTANPDGRVFTHLAEAYRKAGAFDHALKTIMQGLQRHETYPSAHVVLGRILLDLGDEPGAESAFGRVLRLDPENRVALRALADLAQRSGRERESIALYRELLVLDPNDQEIVSIARAIEDALRVPETYPEPGQEFEQEFEQELDAEAGGPGEWAGGVPESTVHPAFDSPITRAAELVDPPTHSPHPMPLDADRIVDGDVEGKGGPAGGWRLAGGDPSDMEILNVELPDVEIADEGDDPSDSSWGSDFSRLPEDGEAIDAGPGGEVFGPVVTETMAEIYVNQGLLERAMGLYSELLQGRPGDERLMSRLAQLQAMVAGPTPLRHADPIPAVDPNPPAEGFSFFRPGALAGEADRSDGADAGSWTGVDEDLEFDPRPEDVEDLIDEIAFADLDWVDGIDIALPMLSGALDEEGDQVPETEADPLPAWESAGGAMAAAEPEAPVAVAEPEGPSRPIGGYFRTLLAFRPAMPEGAGSGVEAEGAVVEAASPPREDADTGAEWAVAFLADDTFLEVEEEVLLELVEADVVEEEIQEPADAGMPDISDFDWGPPAAREDDLIILDDRSIIEGLDAEDEFDHLFRTPPAIVEEAVEGDGLAVRPSDPPETGPASPASEAVEGNDEDLEMFRAWLRNLKR